MCPSVYNLRTPIFVLTLVLRFKFAFGSSALSISPFFFKANRRMFFHAMLVCQGVSSSRHQGSLERGGDQLVGKPAITATVEPQDRFLNISERPFSSTAQLF